MKKAGLTGFHYAVRQASSPIMNQVCVFSPAKVNLMLSVHGRRGDGYHELSSVMAPLTFGDDLTVKRTKGSETIWCSDPQVPVDEGNLARRAAGAFRRASGQETRFEFELKKRIPVGAGLGGGSSNAVAALVAMNRLCGSPLSLEALESVAVGLGADCAFFLADGPRLVGGRGEQVSAIDERCRAYLSGQPLALFKPEFGVATAWAYRRLAETHPSAYEPIERAAARLRRFKQDGDCQRLLFNSFEPVISEKFRAIRTLLAALRASGTPCLMSGSGSCCVALLPASRADQAALREEVRAAWGAGVFWIETSIRDSETTEPSAGQRLPNA